MARVRIAWLVAVHVLMSTLAFGQATPVVLVHGLKSDQHTWDKAASELQTQLDIQPYQPNPSWQDTYNVQGQTLQNLLGSLPSTVISIGHSNGGVVSREWSKHRYLSGLITVGTPHSGAPLAGLAANWPTVVNGFGQFAANILGDFAQCLSSSNCSWHTLIYSGGLHSALGEIGTALAKSKVELLTTHGLLSISAPVLTQMAPGSAYLEELNSPANLARERSGIGTRVAIVSVARNYDRAGWYRSFDPDHADLIADLVDVASVLLDQGAGTLEGVNDSYYNIRTDASFWMRNLAGLLLRLDSSWCELVSGGLCVPNDTIVPTFSQRHPDVANVIPITLLNGPVHIRETTETIPQINEALVNFMNVRPRSSGGNAVGSGTPSVMQGDAAIRGCSNYVEWSPVFQPTASTCRDHCAANGANACEWYQDGSCYVEFGSGCRIQPGYAGWSAGLITASPPTAPPTATPPGYIGCFTDAENRALPVWFGEGHTIETCVEAAARSGYAYAGLQYYGHCFAGNALGYSQVSNGECSTPCNANSGEMCGGAWRNSVFTASSAASSPPPPSSQNGPTYVGCFTDTEDRALPVWLGEGHTIESCTAAAAQSGYAYAGLQYYGHCFAGNSIGFSQVGNGECNTACDANSSEMCGGAWRNSIYTVR